MHQCPKCKSEDIHRSRSRSLWESWRKEITDNRLYRCRACGWRGWGPNRASTLTDPRALFDANAEAPVPANLQGTPLERRSSQFTDVDLDALDALEPTTDRRR
jgi:hypothetical protein